MSRFLASLLCDSRLQFRNGFYYAAGFIAAIWILILHWIPAESVLWLLPVLVFSNVLMNTFYFIAGLVLLEKDEGTLSAVVVTPLRSREYLASKVTTLTLLALVENAAIAKLGIGGDIRLLPLLLGMTLCAVQMTLVGFLAVSRYHSVNEYLLPSVLYTGLFLPPFLDYLDLYKSWLTYLHPTTGPLLLAAAAFRPMEDWRLWCYALLYPCLWIGILAVWSLRDFRRFITASAGRPNR